jgi:multidrug resistance efflux pump
MEKLSDFWSSMMEDKPWEKIRIKINPLYVLWALAAGVGVWISATFMVQSADTFFGSAETEGQVLSLEHPVLVEKVYVQVGNQVKKGDTLAVCLRSDLDKNAVDKSGEIKQFEIEKQTKSAAIQQELGVLRAQKTALISELEAQIKLIKAEENIQSALKEAINGNNKTAPNSSNLKAEKINALRESIKQTERQIRQQAAQLSQQLNANESIYSAKMAQAEEQMSFIEKDKQQLVLIAPIDGFVENVAAISNEIAPQYKELIKLNPSRPNKIRGFIHESTEIHYQLGDTVDVSSVLRSNIATEGVIIGSSPQLVELPLRLRKFTTRSAWGREIYVKLIGNNDFFISEKVLITLNPLKNEADRSTKPSNEIKSVEGAIPVKNMATSAVNAVQ